MQRPHGYAQIISDGPLVERDTVTCGHCGAIVLVKPGTASTVYLVLNNQTLRYDEVPGAGCSVCMRPVCLRCYDIGTCTPFERTLELMERPRGR